MFDNAEVVDAAVVSDQFPDRLLDRCRKTGETVDERRHAPQCPARVADIARNQATVVVRELNYPLRSHEALGEKRGFPALGYEDEIHLRESGEIVQQRSGPKCSAAV